MPSPARLTPGDISVAAGLLIDARRAGRRLGGLPESVRPARIEDGHAIQDAVFAALGEPIGAIKVNIASDGTVFRGFVEQSRVFASPATLSASEAGLMEVEAEVAFLFADGVEPREDAYSRDEVAALAQAMPAFDIVDTRLTDFMARSLFERIADSLNAGTFVHAAPVARWREIDFHAMQATLSVDGTIVVSKAGGHPFGDPLVPAIAYINANRDHGLPPRTILTTGSFTGLQIARPLQKLRADFAGFGAAEVWFSA